MRPQHGVDHSLQPVQPKTCRGSEKARGKEAKALLRDGCRLPPGMIFEPATVNEPPKAPSPCVCHPFGFRPLETGHGQWLHPSSKFSFTPSLPNKKCLAVGSDPAPWSGGCELAREHMLVEMSPVNAAGHPAVLRFALCVLLGSKQLGMGQRRKHAWILVLGSGIHAPGVKQPAPIQPGLGQGCTPFANARP